MVQLDIHSLDSVFYANRIETCQKSDYLYYYIKENVVVNSYTVKLHSYPYPLVNRTFFYCFFFLFWVGRKGNKWVGNFVLRIYPSCHSLFVRTVRYNLVWIEASEHSDDSDFLHSHFMAISSQLLALRVALNGTPSFQSSHLAEKKKQSCQLFARTEQLLMGGKKSANQRLTRLALTVGVLLTVPKLLTLREDRRAVEGRKEISSLVIWVSVSDFY